MCVRCELCAVERSGRDDKETSVADDQLTSEAATWRMSKRHCCKEKKMCLSLCSLRRCVERDVEGLSACAGRTLEWFGTTVK